MDLNNLFLVFSEGLKGSGIMTEKDLQVQLDPLVIQGHPGLPRNIKDMILKFQQRNLMMQIETGAIR